MKKTYYFYRRDLKILLLGLFVILTVGLTNAQQNTEERKQIFEKEMNAYIATQIDEEITEIKQNANLIENFDEYSEEDIRIMARAYAKDKYIRHNMKEYLNTYFSDPQAMITTDTFVCDNGGFEDDFLYYKGYTSYFKFGSDSCVQLADTPNVYSVFSLAALPTTKRFEIVTSGVDDLTGIQRVKFGNKALKINDRHGHIHNCEGDHGVDKIIKRFKVTDKTRDFTVWYSVALENPSGHENRQPFLNIKCDLAPDNELCFDADVIKCAQYYSDPCAYDSIDVLDWSCHRFKIPEDKVGQIATLEIVVGDCGKGAHFGYAYIDGICEECDSSALGSAFLDENINYRSCNGDIATICGTYTAPAICSNGGTWAPVEITVPGYTISDLVIDTASKSFCFNFPITNFTDEECLEIYAELTFNNGVFDLPEVLTNSINVCKKQYDEYNISVAVSRCVGNSTSDLSDDYYFVNIDLTNTGGDSWTITKQLTDPYSGESGLQTLGNGTGDAYLEYGPFYKQDGDWWLTIDIGNCHYVELIEAPGYCSGCDKFNDLEIRNIQCINDGSGDYKWKFDLFVPCGGSSWGYNVSGVGLIGGSARNCGEVVFFEPGTISNGCVDITLTQVSCSSVYTITVCPPKPCPKEGDCDLEVYVKDVTCLEPDQNGNQDYEVELDISGEGNKHVCIFWNGISVGYIYPYLTIPFSTDVDLKVALCDDALCTQNCNNCYKWIHLSKPDCRDPRFGGKKGKGRGMRLENNFDFGNLTIIPNPVISDEILILSNMETTEFEIYNSSGQLIKQGNFTGDEYKLSLSIVPGLYFVRYNNGNGQSKFVKMIKL